MAMIQSALPKTQSSLWMVADGEADRPEDHITEEGEHAAVGHDFILHQQRRDSFDYLIQPGRDLPSSCNGSPL